MSQSLYAIIGLNDMSQDQPDSDISYKRLAKCLRTAIPSSFFCNLTKRKASQSSSPHHCWIQDTIGWHLLQKNQSDMNSQLHSIAAKWSINSSLKTSSKFALVICSVIWFHILTHLSAVPILSALSRQRVYVTQAAPSECICGSFRS